MKFPINDFFSNQICWKLRNCSHLLENGKLHFLCSVVVVMTQMAIEEVEAKKH